MDKCKSFFNNFFDELYLGVLFLLTFSNYVFDVPVFFYILLTIITLGAYIYKKSPIYFIPSALFSQMAFSYVVNYENITPYYVILGSGFLLFDVIYNKRFQYKGKLLYPLLLLLLASVITFVNTESIYYSFIGVLQVVVLLVVYLYFINISKELSFKFIINMLMWLSILASTQIIFAALTAEQSFLVTLRARNDDLVGWENLNVVFFTSLIAIPLVAYRLVSSKYKFTFIIILFYITFGVFLTFSRSALLTVFVYVVTLVPLVIIFTKDRKRLFMSIGVSIVVGIFYLIIFDMTLLYELTDILFDRELLSIVNRTPVMRTGVEKFYEYPLFGSGGLYTSKLYLVDLRINNYHNTILQTLTMGIIGLIAFVYLQVNKLKIIFGSKSSIKYFVFVMIVGTIFINGMFQPMYYYSTYMIIMLLIIASLEKNSEVVL